MIHTLIILWILRCQLFNYLKRKYFTSTYSVLKLLYLKQFRRNNSLSTPSFFIIHRIVLNQQSPASLSTCRESSFVLSEGFTPSEAFTIITSLGINTFARITFYPRYTVVTKFAIDYASDPLGDSELMT